MNKFKIDMFPCISVLVVVCLCPWLKLPCVYNCLQNGDLLLILSCRNWYDINKIFSVSNRDKVSIFFFSCKLLVCQVCQCIKGQPKYYTEKPCTYISPRALTCLFKPVFLNWWAVDSFIWASNLVILLSFTSKLYNFIIMQHYI